MLMMMVMMMVIMMGYSRVLHLDSSTSVVLALVIGKA
jgi:hypothetical protein